MKILLINKFLYPKGGDALSTLATAGLLSAKGHQVMLWGMSHPLNPEYPYKQYFVSRVDFERPGGALRQIKTAGNLLYSREAKEKIERLVKKERPDIAHLNNFAHQISPSILHIFKRYHIPVVMTMHDYKLVCPSYSMLSKGRVCELCKNGRYYHCFREGCVKDSRVKSLLNTIEMYLHHRILRIYDLIDVFIAPSRFLMSKCAEMGLKGRVVYLPNFVSLEEYQPQYTGQENAIVYFGRLSEEKGLETLLEAMRGLKATLKVIGEGPLTEGLKLKVNSQNLANIHFLGYKSGEGLREEIRKAMLVVLPSEWYENNPRSVIEAFALGKPVVGARIGGIPELVKDNQTGLTFAGGDAEDLKAKIARLLNSPAEIERMGRNARRFVEEEFNAESHYAGLLRIYAEAGAPVNNPRRRFFYTEKENIRSEVDDFS